MRANLVLATMCISAFSPSMAEETAFREIVQDCTLAKVVMGDSPGANRTQDDYIRAIRCLRIMQGLITVMQLNCFSKQDGQAQPDARFSIAPTNAGQAAEAIIAYSLKFPDRMGQPALTEAASALSNERPREER